MIFDLIIEESLETGETEVVANTIEKLFDSIGASPMDYGWVVNNVEDAGEIRQVGLTNLFIAAQDLELLPSVLDIDDCEFDDDTISINIGWYEEDEQDQIRDAIENLSEKTGLIISTKR